MVLVVVLFELVVLAIICHLIFICMHSVGCHLANFKEEQLKLPGSEKQKIFQN